MENGNMTPLVPRQDGRLEWGNGVVSMLFDIAADSPVRLCNVVGRNMVPIDGRLSDDGKPVVEKDPRPIVEVCAANTGSQDNRLTLIATVAGSQLRFVSALASEPEPGSADPFRLEITQFAPYADLEPKGREFEPTASGFRREFRVRGGFRRFQCRLGGHFRIRSVPESFRSAHLHASAVRQATAD